MISKSLSIYFVVSVALTSSAYAANSVVYDTERDVATDQWCLFVKSNDLVLRGPCGEYVEVDEERDLNGDGVLDALVSVSGGGNCCPSTYMVASVKDGKLVISELETEWADYSVIEDNGELLVKQKTSAVTNVYRFDGRVATKVRVIEQLKALSEIYGVGALYTGKLKTKTLKADIDIDGRVDSIICDIWPRWGSLANCGLPLPKGRVQYLEYACDRIGVLASARNGYREVVCNNDDVIYFDGKVWHTK